MARASETLSPRLWNDVIGIKTAAAAAAADL